MAGSSQPQHFLAAECVFTDFTITVFFLFCNKNVIKFFVHNIWVLPHSNIKINFGNMLENVPKLGLTLNFLEFWITSVSARWCVPYAVI